MSGEYELSAKCGTAWDNNPPNNTVEFNAESNDRVLLEDDAIEIFRRRSADRIKTYDLIGDLSAIPNRPWSGMSTDLRSAHRLARLLRPSLIRPTAIKFGSRTAKGYYRRSFERALQRRSVCRQQLDRP